MPQLRPQGKVSSTFAARYGGQVPPEMLDF
jgi:hypothetical protein